MMRTVKNIDPLTNDPTTPVRLENLGDQIMIWNDPELWTWLDWDSEDLDNTFTYEDFIKDDKYKGCSIIKTSCALTCLMQ